MDIAVFIRTYSKDFQWLSLALKSLHQHVRGFKEIVVAAPDIQGLQHLTAEKVVQCEDMEDGYIGQQLTKLLAFQYTDAEYLLYWDSDVVALEDFNIEEELFEQGRPILYKTAYDQIECPWQPITAAVIGFEPQFEYMRRMPLVYHRSDVERAVAHMEILHKKPLRQYLEQLPPRAFSEFNVLGALIDKYKPEEYAIRDTATYAAGRNKVRQFWSWGGITQEVLQEIAEKR